MSPNPHCPYCGGEGVTGGSDMRPCDCTRATPATPLAGQEGETARTDEFVCRFSARFAVNGHAIRALSEFGSALERDLAETRKLAAVDGPVFNQGRHEGHSDIRLKLQLILDPADDQKLNIDGLLKKVEETRKERDAAQSAVDGLRADAENFANQLTTLREKLAEAEREAANQERRADTLSCWHIYANLKGRKALSIAGGHVCDFRAAVQSTIDLTNWVRTKEDLSLCDQVADLRARLAAVQAESKEWQNKAMDVEKHPAVVALLKERDEALARLAVSEADVAELKEIRGCVDWGAISAGRATALSEVQRTIAALREYQHSADQLRIRAEMAEDKIANAESAIAGLREACEECRDNILNGRGPLEATLDNDQTNAVLGVFDDAFQAALASPGVAGAQALTHDCKEHAVDIGECDEGCCDKYRCSVCGKTWLSEVAQ